MFKYFGQRLAEVPLAEIETGMAVRSEITGNYGLVTMVDRDFDRYGRIGLINVTWMNAAVSGGYYYHDDWPKDDQHFSRMIVLGHISDLDSSYSKKQDQQ